MTPSLSQKKRHTGTIVDRPTIELNRNYNRREAALAVGCSVITLIRAYDSGHLKAYRVGRRILHSGAHLIEWMEAGGKTASLKGGA